MRSHTAHVTTYTKPNCLCSCAVRINTPCRGSTSVVDVAVWMIPHACGKKIRLANVKIGAIPISANTTALTNAPKHNAAKKFCANFRPKVTASVCLFLAWSASKSRRLIGVHNICHEERTWNGSQQRQNAISFGLHKIHPEDQRGSHQNENCDFT